MTRKFTLAQQNAVDAMRAWGKPFRVFPPKYMGRFGTSTAHYAPRAEDYETARTPSSFIIAPRWTTYEALVKAGVITEISRFPVDATESARHGNGRIAVLAELVADEVPANG